MAENKQTQPDYRHLSYNEMVDLIVNLYKEMRRATKAAIELQNALDNLNGVKVHLNVTDVPFKKWYQFWK